METFETKLTGSDGSVDGIVSPVTHIKNPVAYGFKSLDDSLHLLIAKNSAGHWVRLGGTEPYFSGWVDELAEKIELAIKAEQV